MKKRDSTVLAMSMAALCVVVAAAMAITDQEKGKTARTLPKIVWEPGKPFPFPEKAFGPPQPMRWQVSVSVSHQGKDDDLKLAAGRALADQPEKNSRSRERLEYFDWILSKPEIKLAGWSLHVLDASKTQDGWLVRVKVRPRLDSTLSAYMTTTDYCIETWQCVDSDRKLKLLKSEGSKEVRSLIGH